jgi:hypothetical protein
MSYKTVLVHCNDERRIEGLLAPAPNLAESFQSHLIGLSVVPPVVVVSADVPIRAPIVLNEHCKIYRERNRVLKSAFEAATRSRGCGGEWREDEADADGVAAVLLNTQELATLSSPAKRIRIGRGPNGLTCPTGW